MAIIVQNVNTNWCLLTAHKLRKIRNYLQNRT